MSSRQTGSACAVLFLGLLVCQLAYAKSAVCPSARELLTADIPAGQFAPSMWKLVDAMTQVTDLSGSILVFSSEKKTDPGLQVEAYFWWRRDGSLIGCSKLDGDYDRETRQINLRTRERSANVIPPLSWFKARLSDDGMALQDFKIIWSESGANNSSLWLNQRGLGNRAGPWKLLKVFPLSE